MADMTETELVAFIDGKLGTGGRRYNPTGGDNKPEDAKDPTSDGTMTKEGDYWVVGEDATTTTTKKLVSFERTVFAPDGTPILDRASVHIYVKTDGTAYLDKAGWKKLNDVVVDGQLA